MKQPSEGEKVARGLPPALLERLVSGATHDLSSPLTYMRINLEALADHRSNLAQLTTQYERIAEALGRSHPLVVELERMQADAGCPDALAEAEELLAQTCTGLERMVSMVTALRRLAQAPLAGVRLADPAEALADARQLTSPAVRGRLAVAARVAPTPSLRFDSGTLALLLVSAIMAVADAEHLGDGMAALSLSLGPLDGGGAALGLKWQGVADARALAEALSASAQGMLSDAPTIDWLDTGRDDAASVRISPAVEGGHDVE